MPVEWKHCPLCTSSLTSRADEHGVERLGCSSCEFVRYDNPTPVVAGIVEHGDNVILVQNKGWPSHWFGLVTGFLERGEDPAKAVLRELEEELGLQGEVVSLVGLFPFENMNQLIIAYHVRAQGSIRKGDELEAYREVAIHKLRPWPLATGEAVRVWLESREKQPSTTG